MPQSDVLSKFSSFLQKVTFSEGKYQVGMLIWDIKYWYLGY